MSDSLGSLNVHSKLGFLKAVLRDTIHAALTSVGQLPGSPLEQTWTCGKDSNTPLTVP